MRDSLKRGIFVLYYLFFLSTPIVEGNIIHVIGKNDFASKIKESYRDNLGGKSLIEVNSHLKKIIYVEKKELIVSDQVRISFCSHIVRPGEWLVKIIRKYSYKSSYSLGFTLLAIKKNSHIKNPDLINIGDKLSIPILSFGMKDKHWQDEKSCTSLFKDHKKVPFIVRNRNAYYEQRKGSVLFYPGFPMKGSQINLTKEKGGESDLNRLPTNEKDKRKVSVSSASLKSKKDEKKVFVSSFLVKSKKDKRKASARSASLKNKKDEKKASARSPLVKSKKDEKKASARSASLKSKKDKRKVSVRSSLVRNKKDERRVFTSSTSLKSKKDKGKASARSASLKSKKDKGKASARSASLKSKKDKRKVSTSSPLLKNKKDKRKASTSSALIRNKKDKRKAFASSPLLKSKKDKRKAFASSPLLKSKKDKRKASASSASLKSKKGKRKGSASSASLKSKKDKRKVFVSSFLVKSKKDKRKASARSASLKSKKDKRKAFASSPLLKSKKDKRKAFASSLLIGKRVEGYRRSKYSVDSKLDLESKEFIREKEELSKKGQELANIKQELGIEKEELSKKGQELANIKQELGIEKEELSNKGRELASVKQELGIGREELINKGRELASVKQELGIEKEELEQERQKLASKRRKLIREEEELLRKERKLKFGDEAKASKVAFHMTGIFDSLHDKSSSSVIVSELQPSFGVEWRQRWSFVWRSFLGIDLTFKNYRKNTLNNKVITHRKFVQGEVYAGINYSWGKLSFVNLSFGIKESVHYRQRIEDIYSIEKDQSLTGKLKISKEFIRYKFLRGAVLMQVRSISEGHSGFDGGVDYGAGLSLDYSGENYSIRSGVLYHEGSFHSKWSTFEHRWLEFTTSLMIGF